MPGRIASSFAVIITLIPFAVSCGSSSNSISDTKVVYGLDNRRDVYESGNNATMRALASSTVALIKTTSLKPISANSFRISAVTLGTKVRLCEKERFRDQPAAAHCSGFLVGSDTVVTAGHCIRDQKTCETTSFVFGYAYTSRESNPSTIAKSEVYSCSSIVKTSTSADVDFAVIKLSRKVRNHQPLKFRRSGKPYAGTRLTLIGNPSGLPTKIAGSASIRSNSNPNFMVATTDSFGGNSGSAVFNSQTGVVEGILVRGERDYVPNGSCMVVKQCSTTECRGEDVTRATLFAPYVR